MEQRTTKWYQDMDKVAKIRTEIERLKKCSESAKMEWIPAGYNQNAFAEDCRIASFNKLLFFIDSLQEKPTIVYVVTRCEEHDDYVEEVFFDANKAQEYCNQFKGNENEYARHITKVEVTL